MAKQKHVDAIVDLISAELFAYPHQLRMMGFGRREWEAAVRQGKLRWARNGSLQLASAYCR